VGNAFIAVADDATAASWNPAGLVQLEQPEVSGVGSFYVRRDEFRDAAHSFETGDNLFLRPGTHTTESLDVNFLSIAYPFRIFGTHATVSLNYQRQFDFNREFDFQGRNVFVDPNFPDDPPVESDLTFQLEQEGSLYALTPALAVQITRSLSLGATLNIWSSAFFQESAWSSQRVTVQTWLVPDTDPVEIIRSTTIEREDFRNFQGVNATFGLLWNITPQVSFGAVADLPFCANLDVDLEIEDPDVPQEDPGRFQRVSQGMKMDFPWSYGFGVAYRPTDQLTISVDYMRVEWGDFLYWSESGQKYSVITGEVADEQGKVDVDATNAARLGAEYLFIYPEARIVWPLRAGVFYEPEPDEGSPNTFFGFSIGTGVGFKWGTFDVAYVFKFGNDIHPGTIDLIRNIPGASEDVQQHTLLFSSVLWF
jgi:long-subunit fatty acid transport protein